MVHSRRSFLSPATSFTITALILGMAVLSVAAGAQTAVPPYTLSTFAQSTSAFSQPDSLERWRNSILVGYQNHVAKDGTDGKFSTIVQYSLSGKMERAFQVKGHNDGLRVIGENQLWAIQNEDGNPNLAVIDLESGHQKVYSFPPTPHGGGYDDLRVKNGEVYVTASNPINLDSAGVNEFPALVRVKLSGDSVEVEPVLNGNATAIDIPTGTTTTLNLMDPDSLSIDARGNIVMDSQADGELIFIRNPLSANPTVGRLSLTTSAGPTTVDDTAFASSAKDFLLVSDVGGGIVYRIDSPMFGFEPGVPYTASDSEGYVGVLNLDTGLITKIVTGMQSGRGMLFVSPKSEGEHEKHDE